MRIRGGHLKDAVITEPHCRRPLHGASDGGAPGEFHFLGAQWGGAHDLRHHGVDESVSSNHNSAYCAARHIHHANYNHAGPP